MTTECTEHQDDENYNGCRCIFFYDVPHYIKNPETNITFDGITGSLKSLEKYIKRKGGVLYLTESDSLDSLGDYNVKIILNNEPDTEKYLSLGEIIINGMPIAGHWDFDSFPPKHRFELWNQRLLTASISPVFSHPSHNKLIFRYINSEDLSFDIKGNASFRERLEEFHLAVNYAIPKNKITYSEIHQMHIEFHVSADQELPYEIVTTFNEGRNESIMDVCINYSENTQWECFRDKNNENIIWKINGEEEIYNEPMGAIKHPYKYPAIDKQFPQFTQLSKISGGLYIMNEHGDPLIFDNKVDCYYREMEEGYQASLIKNFNEDRVDYIEPVQDGYFAQEDAASIDFIGRLGSKKNNDESEESVMFSYYRKKSSNIYPLGDDKNISSGPSLSFAGETPDGYISATWESSRPTHSTGPIPFKNKNHFVTCYDSENNLYQNFLRVNVWPINNAIIKNVKVIFSDFQPSHDGLTKGDSIDLSEISGYKSIDFYDYEGNHDKDKTTFKENNELYSPESSFSALTVSYNGSVTDQIFSFHTDQASKGVCSIEVNYEVPVRETSNGLILDDWDYDQDNIYDDFGVIEYHSRVFNEEDPEIIKRPIPNTFYNRESKISLNRHIKNAISSASKQIEINILRSGGDQSVKGLTSKGDVQNINVSNGDFIVYAYLSAEDRAIDFCAFSLSDKLTKILMPTDKLMKNFNSNYSYPFKVKEVKEDIEILGPYKFTDKSNEDWNYYTVTVGSAYEDSFYISDKRMRIGNPYGKLSIKSSDVASTEKACVIKYEYLGESPKPVSIYESVVEGTVTTMTNGAQFFVEYNSEEKLFNFKRVSCEKYEYHHSEFRPKLIFIDGNKNNISSNNVVLIYENANLTFNSDDKLVSYESDYYDSNVNEISDFDISGSDSLMIDAQIDESEEIFLTRSSCYEYLPARRATNADQLSSIKELVGRIKRNKKSILRRSLFTSQVPVEIINNRKETVEHLLNMLYLYESEVVTTADEKIDKAEEIKPLEKIISEGNDLKIEVYKLKNEVETMPSDIFFSRSKYIMNQIDSHSHEFQNIIREVEERGERYERSLSYLRGTKLIVVDFFKLGEVIPSRESFFLKQHADKEYKEVTPFTIDANWREGLCDDLEYDQLESGQSSSEPYRSDIWQIEAFSEQYAGFGFKLWAAELLNNVKLNEIFNENHSHINGTYDLQGSLADYYDYKSIRDHLAENNNLKNKIKGINQYVQEFYLCAKSSVLLRHYDRGPDSDANIYVAQHCANLLHLDKETLDLPSGVHHFLIEVSGEGNFIALKFEISYNNGATWEPIKESNIFYIKPEFKKTPVMGVLGDNKLIDISTNKRVDVDEKIVFWSDPTPNKS